MAVREGNIVELEPSEVEWQGRTVINAAIAISGGAYPEMLEETSIGENTDPTSKIEDNVSSALASARPEDSSAPEYEHDGYYGEHTGECVKEFQRVNGLEQTGVADVDTLKRLYSTLAKDKDGKVPAIENAPTMGPNSGDNSSSSSSEDGDGSSSEG